MMLRRMFELIESKIVRVRFGFNELSSYMSRDVRDEVTISYLKVALKDRDRHASVSAIYRVKNGAQFIELSILSVAPLCREIIVVDNGSTDSTLEIVERLKNELKDVIEIKIFHYPLQVALAGKKYKDEIKEFPERSLAKYYNYAFSLATSDFLMKCDAHYIYTPAGLDKIRKKLISNPDYNDVISFRGIEIFGAMLSCEPFLIRKNSFEYYDSDFFEILKVKRKRDFFQRIKTKIYSPCFIHVKRLSYIKSISHNGYNAASFLYKIDD